MFFLKRKVSFNSEITRKNIYYALLKRLSSSSSNKQLTLDRLKEIESDWKHSVINYINENQSETLSGDGKKKYILSMFPYPSGNLHMGHVRVYTISDTLARFYHMRKWKVIHPMGWDAFGLPAENAAIERGINPEEWTRNNIQKMKKQLQDLGCGFEWWREVATNDPKYYKWTQFIFLKLFRSGLAYRQEAMVNWDPIDQTVLANEQVDQNGCSWRSGAKVEKKLLTQWFIKATSLSKDLYEDLSDPSLVKWRDIPSMQKHWIGECNGYIIEMKIQDRNNRISTVISHLPVWMSHPENVPNISFLAVKSDHILNKDIYKESTTPNYTLLNLKAIEPVTKRFIPIIINDQLAFDDAEIYVGIPSFKEEDRRLCAELKISIPNIEGDASTREEVLQKVKDCNGGGYQSSGKLKDWLISRQRYWGTPIPIVYCAGCGAVPVPENELPVQLPKVEGQLHKGVSVLKESKDWLRYPCPKCGGDAQRETDTMDTFMDSSWYFLRYLDPKNEAELIGQDRAESLMPVDLYIGGKEHATLHLYYARFMHKFLTQCGLAKHKEPFSQLLVQGMVKSKSFQVESTGRYLRPDQIDFSVSPPVEKTDKLPLLIQFEKMSKSKHNGVDPQSLLEEFGVDAVRLAISANAGPQSERNWDSKDMNLSVQILNKLWNATNNFVCVRGESHRRPDEGQEEHDNFLFETRNKLLLSASNHFEATMQFHSAIRCVQQMISALRKVPQSAVFSDEYEKTVRSILLILAPICPHITAELWQRVNDVTESPQYGQDTIHHQPWPCVDPNYKMELNFKVNGDYITTMRLDQAEYSSLTKEKALQLANENKHLSSLISGSPIINSVFKHSPNNKANLAILTKTH